MNWRIEDILERQMVVESARSSGIRHFRISTSNPVMLALLLTQNTSKTLSSAPHLVVFPRSEEAWKFQQCINFFQPGRTCEVLPHLESTPYSGLSVKSSLIGDRCRFLYHAQNAKPGEIFVAPIGSLMQRTLPFNILANQTKHFRRDSQWPEQAAEWLVRIGYSAVPVIDDVGQFAQRGGIFDIFSPAHQNPIRIELFGNTVESLRSFSPVDGRSLADETLLTVIPVREVFYAGSNPEELVQRFRRQLGDRPVDRSEIEEIVRSLSRGTNFQGMEFAFSYFYDTHTGPIEHFGRELNVWRMEPDQCQRHADELWDEFTSDFRSHVDLAVRPAVEDLLRRPEDSKEPDGTSVFTLSSSLENLKDDEEGGHTIDYRTQSVVDFLSQINPGSQEWDQRVGAKIRSWISSGNRVVVAVKNQTQAQRLQTLLTKIHLETTVQQEPTWHEFSQSSIHLVLRYLPENVFLAEERLVLLREEDLLGRKQRLKAPSPRADFGKEAQRLNFADLKPGDYIVHVLHGVGVYEGLRVLEVSGIKSEFIQLTYKDKNILYLPIYRIGQIQKYSGGAGAIPLDRLGGSTFEKTKVKVRSHLRDIAAELLLLYAKRSEAHREPIVVETQQLTSFEAAFPYDETDHQLHAIKDVYRDLTSNKPMDRLICGDVGFGKTEVAMRAAFLVASSGRQVAVLSPTTVLSFQHLETFTKRFHGWPIELRGLNRFIEPKEAKKSLKGLSEGKVDVLIGTHRILSKDVVFKNLGLLIVDEEQKFGVTHKEKIRKLRASVDTITMSATPIPRTLNMSLQGIIDLSLINTPPVDRLPTRTFLMKFNGEKIRKAIESEIQRGGQVYFVHNRVQSIYAMADELRQIVPQARIRVGHGQMTEHELESTMMAFFKHEIDVLLCTTIIESGVDNPRANTMFIDIPQTLGLSQLYQLRGRVGRSKDRAYCYLILPTGRELDKDVQERLKVLQDNTDLGSGIRIAQYDLELRGAGNILGDEQSGHINSVGYELYMDLLDQTLSEMKGEPAKEDPIDPEINLRIPALIPDSYMSDVRLRISYYKALSEIESEADLEKIESDLRDQFGEIPEPTMNLLGIMLIRSICKFMCIRDLSAGPKMLAIYFSPSTPIKTETALKLSQQASKKYALTPDGRLTIRMNEITWPNVYEELKYLKNPSFSESSISQGPGLNEFRTCQAGLYFRCRLCSSIGLIQSSREMASSIQALNVGTRVK